MEKRKARRKTWELKAASDAESTVSTRSSTSSNSSSLWKEPKRRLKAQHLNRHGNGSAPSQLRTCEDEEDQATPLESRLGAILETTEAQVIMILLIALDIISTAVEIHLHDQQQLHQLNSKRATADASTEVIAPRLARVVTRLVESFTGFTLFLFLIELAVLLAALRRKFFAHAGYVLDLAVVSVSVTVELYAQTKAVRLLGILRVWRVLRLVRHLVDQERAAHDATRQLLEQEQLKLLHVRMQKEAAQESLKCEYESRAGLEQLLRVYKDEIVTLKEALQIAAQAVAEATMAESSDAENSLGLYRAADHEHSEEYNHHEEAAVHPTGLQTEHRQDSGFYHQEAEVYPSEMQDLHVDGELWQEDRQVAVSSTAEQIELKSDNGFEDAVDE